MASGSQPTAPAGLVLGLAALGGAGTMTVELAAVRLLAPWFGTSLVVWTNVIGVILLALAVGYLGGARLSGGAQPLRRLGTVLLVAGATTALLPAAVGPVARLFLPGSLNLDEALPLVVWGSLASSLALFLVPAALLGTVAPLAVESLQRARGGQAGDAGGRVLCASTLGSLAGVFGTTHVLVPGVGLRATFLVAAALLAAAGGLALWAARGRALFGLVVLPVGAALVPPSLRPEVPEGWELLAARESRYQSLRVSEDRRAEPFFRHLQVNEGFDSFQSVWQPVLGLLPEGFYYNFFALPLHWSEARGPVRVLVLGLGGGTAWRVLDGAAPQGAELLHEGVELDPDVVELAREHLDLPPDGPRHAARGGLDARVALAAGREPVQLAILDCYANQVEIPPHLVTVEFLRAVRDTLAPDGWLAANLGGFGLDDPLVEAVAATCAEAFEHRVLLLRVPSSRNFVLIARRDGELPVEGGVLRPIYDHPVGDLLRPLELPGGFRIVGPEDGTVLTDDFAPVERLQLASIREARQRIEGASR